MECCDPDSGYAMTIPPDAHPAKKALQELTVALPAVAEALRLVPRTSVASLVKMIQQRLLTRLSPDFPLLAAICGGGSAGKSTLFNSLAGAALSPTGGRAGMNRRALLAAHPDLLQRPHFCDELFAPLDSAPRPLEESAALTRPGPPLYAAHGGLPADLVLLDTPDFDTGARGVYTNRALARQALTACDLFIYIFTNSNYNNRDNTDFIADLLTGIGLRKSILVYRAYPGFSAAEVREHAATVASNIYGNKAGEGVLGVYRADEDNAVAAGERPMQLRPLDPEQPSLRSALGRLDRYALRAEFLDALVADVVGETDALVRGGRLARHALETYLASLRTVQSHCVRHALRSFPMDLVMGRFAEIWLAGDPAHIRVMRQTGTVLAWPVKMLSGLVRRAAGRPPAPDAAASGQDLKIQMRENFLEAITRLRGYLLEEALPVGLQADSGESPQDGRKGRRIAVPPALEPEIAGLRHRSWKTTLEELLAQETVLTTLSADTERELRSLADEFRARMGFKDKLTQTFAAMLNVLPATVAVTYILHTGDPVGAAGIKVKLSGLFGLHDLYALVALPATSGLKKTDRKQLELLLAPIAQTWFNSKAAALKALFEDHLTGSVLNYGQDLLTRSGRDLERIAAALATIRSTQESHNKHTAADQTG